MTAVADQPGEGSGDEEIMSGDESEYEDSSEEESSSSESESEEEEEYSSEEDEEEEGVENGNASHEPTDEDLEAAELADQVGELEMSDSEDDLSETESLKRPTERPRFPSSVSSVGGGRRSGAGSGSIAGRTNYSHRTGVTRMTSRTGGGSTINGTSSQSSQVKPKATRPSDIVANDIVKDKVKQEAKHHTRKGMTSAGRAKGHKWKESAAAKVGKGQSDGW